MFAIQRGYLAVVQENGFRLPPRYLEFRPQVERIRAALAVQDEGTVPCHNDLLAANILDDGARLWFIDYEYSATTTRASSSATSGARRACPIDRLEHLVTAYYGYASRAKLARARLLALMSKYGWTLWASIQDAVSEADFDFCPGLGEVRAGRRRVRGPEFAALIDDVAQPDRPRGS